MDGRPGNAMWIMGLCALVAVSGLVSGCKPPVTPTPTYTVSYNGNGNSGGAAPTDSNAYTNGQTVAVSGNAGSMVKSGCSFAGWNTASDGSGADRGPGTTFLMGSANVTLYAKWAILPLDMVSVPAGSFQMGLEGGADAVHRVNLTGFRMSRFEVTQAQYRLVTGDSPSSHPGNEQPVEFVKWFEAAEFCNLLSEREGLEKVYTIADRNPASGYPIVSATVSMQITRNGYRLPTEAEWEYAARGGNGSPGNFLYAGSNAIDAVAWYNDNSGSTTHTVGTLAANSLGLYDMSGNVFEWCWDWFDFYPSTEQSDPTGPSSGTDRARRGGCYSNSAIDCRSTFRSSWQPSSRNGNFGFRVVRRP